MGRITFILNDQRITENVPSGLLALDYLRKKKHLTGSKEGCKEGDCGACTVMVGDLQSDGRVRYRPMTSCLLPMGELQGRHLVTIEGLNMEHLSPIQAAMVDKGGTQCGYCTPGFVVSMTNWLVDEHLSLDLDGLKYAISSNLCRCTGYRSIKDAGCQAACALAPKLEGQERVPALCEAKALPKYFLHIPSRLAEIEKEPVAEEKDAVIIAGGTDLYVQRGEELPDTNVLLLNKRTPRQEPLEEAGWIKVDARMDFESFARNSVIQQNIPQVETYNELVASWAVRTRSTLGGNICNASPIADMTCLLLALGTELELQKGDVIRRLPLKDFYLGYKQLAKEKEEIVTYLYFPKTKEHDAINWEKVSKRAWLDIATVNSAMKANVIDGVVREMNIALGGVAATPFLLKQTSAFLLGKELSWEIVLQALALAQEEFTPISDVRGSGSYKRLLARQLILSHFIKLYPEQIREEEVHAALR